ncbi:hypothetical protein ACFYWX_12950 [Streptomyces sp. NPDC002888]|uniref:hypothetical protein n=1 Tax=Streptomyces sp. NPDC002888 TaxID=3364668 RepID=UPI0036A6C2C5
MAALVVLSLTGFSTSRGHGHGSSHGSGGGGGCSSSSQDHDSSSSTSGGSSGGSGYRDYDDDDYDDDTSGSGGSGDTSTPVLENAETELVSCATEKAPYATVSVTNPNGTGGTFTFDVVFLDEQDDQVTLESTQTYVSANSTTTVKVEVEDTELLPRIDHCEADLYATPVT